MANRAVQIDDEPGYLADEERHVDALRERAGDIRGAVVVRTVRVERTPSRGAVEQRAILVGHAAPAVLAADDDERRGRTIGARRRTLLAGRGGRVSRRTNGLPQAHRRARGRRAR